MNPKLDIQKGRPSSANRLRSPRHRAALQQLIAAFEACLPLVSLIGQGKHERGHLLRAFTCELEKRATVVRLPKSFMEVSAAVRDINASLGFAPKELGHAAQLQILTAYLRSQATQRCRTVLCIEQADDQSPALLKAIASLTDSATSRSGSLMLVMSGSRSLDRLIRESSLQVLFRKIQRVELPAFSRAQSRQFVRDLPAVSRLGDIGRAFTSEAVDRLHEISKGCPERLGKLCHECLLLIRHGQQVPITTEQANKVAARLGFGIAAKDLLLKIGEDYTGAKNLKERVPDVNGPLPDQDAWKPQLATPAQAQPSAHAQAQPLALTGDARLVFWRNGERAREVTICSGTLVIGRESAADVCLSTPGVSRRHAMFTKTEEALKVVDLGSKHGTFLHGRKISECTLEPEDVLTLGDYEIQYVDPAAFVGLLTPVNRT